MFCAIYKNSKNEDKVVIFGDIDNAVIKTIKSAGGLFQTDLITSRLNMDIQGMGKNFNGWLVSPNKEIFQDNYDMIDDFDTINEAQITLRYFENYITIIDKKDQMPLPEQEDFTNYDPYVVKKK